jgi:serine/threonine protein kinase
LKNKVLFKKYKVNQIIGKGSFGCVFKGVNITDNYDIAIKVEKKNSKINLLELESNFLYILKGYGIPQIKSYGKSGKFNILIEELLGYDLHEIKKKQKFFSIKDILMIAIQIMDRIEFIHSKNIIHRDIKPENVTIGYHNSSLIYLIDFGLSKKYRSSRTGKHLKFSFTGKMFGTVRYVSYNGSRGIEQSRRDDLESIGYMLIYIAKGKLPWQGLRFKEKPSKAQYDQMLNLKKTTTPEQLCSELPIEFAKYIQYCKKLTFEQEPDYEYLRNLLRDVIINSEHSSIDFFYDWCKQKPNINKNNIIYTNDYNIKYDGELDWLNRKYCLEENKNNGLDYLNNKNNNNNAGNVYISKNNLIPSHSMNKVIKDQNNNYIDEEKNNEILYKDYIMDEN